VSADFYLIKNTTVSIYYTQLQLVRYQSQLVLFSTTFIAPSSSILLQNVRQCSMLHPTDLKLTKWIFLNVSLGAVELRTIKRLF